MSRRFNFKRLATQGTQSADRVYTLTYVDDPPERQEAISFLGAKSPNQKSEYRRLLPAINLPKEVEGMTAEAGQAYLDAHPMQQFWASLNIDHEDVIYDDDLRRLRFLPEIQRVKIMSSRITNAGVRHLLHLTDLRSLVLYSGRITSGCLGDIVHLKSLETLDLQMSPRVSRSAFEAAVAQLPLLEDVFPPWRWPLSPIVRWFYSEWRVQRKQKRSIVNAL